MKKTVIFALLLIFGTIMLYQQPRLSAAPLGHGEGTATPEGTPASGEGEAADADAEPTLHDLAARIDALQAQVEELETHTATASHETEDATAVTTAVYLLDTAGLHALDVRLNEAKDLQPGDAGTVGRLARLLSSVVWPEELTGDAVSLIDLLNQLATALTNDDLTTAAPLATQVHEAQHAFSHAAEHWLADTQKMHNAAGQAFRVTSAVYLLDTVGLHGLAERLANEKDLQAGDAGTVTRVSRLLSTVDWPAPLATEAISLTTVLNDLATALTNDDLDSATPLADQAHEAQHAFSHAAEHWLADAMEEHHADETTHISAGGSMTDTHTITDTHTMTDTNIMTDTHSSGG